jgi:predicted aldo/keto reductase-like oxidoreductase
MEKQEDKKLSALFQQLGDKKIKQENPDLRLKDAVFSTIDATSLVADIVDLFTFQFFKSQSELIETIPEKKEELKEAYKGDKAAFFAFLNNKNKNIDEK